MRRMGRFYQSSTSRRKIATSVAPGWDAEACFQISGEENMGILGWLRFHGDAKRQFAEYPEYAQLRKAHAEFHLCAGGILSDAHDGNTVAASDGLKRSFRHHSDSVQLALVRLYAREMEGKEESGGAHH